MASRNFRKDAIDGDRELSRKQNQWRRKGQRGYNYRRRESRGTQLLAARKPRGAATGGARTRRTTRTAVLTPRRIARSAFTPLPTPQPVSYRALRAVCGRIERFWDFVLGRKSCFGP